MGKKIKDRKHENQDEMLDKNKSGDENKQEDNETNEAVDDEQDEDVEEETITEEEDEEAEETTIAKEQDEENKSDNKKIKTKGNNQMAQKDKVTVRIPKSELNKDEQFVNVCINGKAIQIKRGVDVEVLPVVKEILENAKYI